MQAQHTSFLDVDNHWAKTQINKWVDAGIITGSSNNFNPDMPITQKDVKDVFEIHEWIIYDKPLTDWFNANDGNTRFSIEDLGNVVFIE